MINVVNKYKHIPTKYDFYIGRGSLLGNPFTSKDLSKTKAEFQADSVEDSIEKYENFLNKKIIDDIDFKNVINDLKKLHKMNIEINLVCFCSPKPCHGDIIKKIIENE